MLFSSMTFIYIFLPIVCLLYYFVKDELKNLVLLLASLVFYAWGEPTYLSIILCIILTNYICGNLLEKFKAHKKIILLLGIVTNLGFLIYFKYFNLLADSINHLFRTNIDFINVIMPIGISFYTFQAMSYIIDIYREKTKPAQNIYKLALYITLFPQLVAGPVLRYTDIGPQIDNREHSFSKISLGVQRFIIGLSKKMLLANFLGEIADKVFIQNPDTFSPAVAWLGVASYMLQIYYDFSGYSDMAIGLGLIFGFKIAENFNHPYYVKSMTEAWHKWHITVSEWFRDYVFGLKWQKLIPAPIRKSSFWKKVINTKLKFKNVYINVICTFFLIGLWHGADWTFAVWGLYNGIVIVLENITGMNKETQNKIFSFLKYFYANLIGILGFVLFRSENFAYATKYYQNMFGCLKIHDVKYTMAYYVDNLQIIVLVIAVLCATPLFAKILKIDSKRIFLKFVINCWLLILFILSTSALAASTYNPFIYFRF